MTPTPRKSGIRLPWSHDDDSDATTAAESGAEASEPTATTDATPMEAGAQAEAAPVPTPRTAQAGAAAQASDEPSSPEEATADVADNALLVSLITAMREVAERERESSVSTLRQSVEISSHPQVAAIFSRPARFLPQITFNRSSYGVSKK